MYSISGSDNSLKGEKMFNYQLLDDISQRANSKTPAIVNYFKRQMHMSMCI